MRNSLSPYVEGPFWNWMTSDFDRFFESAAQNARAFLPYEVKESDGGYMVTIDLPGVKNEDLKIETVEQMLKVSGERIGAGDSEGRKFSYQLSLPVSVDSQRIVANLEHGVLSIALPKAEAAKPRTVEIQSGKSGVFAKLLGLKSVTEEDVQAS